MLIEQEIRNAVVSLSSVTSVNSLTALDKQPLPYVVISKISSVGFNTNSEASNMRISRFQISVFASDYVSAKTYASELYSLKAYESETVSYVALANETDRSHATINAVEVLMDFIVRHYDEEGGS